MAISITEDYPRVSQNHLRFTIEVHGTPFTTTVTSDPEVVRKWLRTTLYRFARFRHRLVVGLGVQWRPASYRGEKPPAATLQLCVGRRCLIFQLRHSPTVPNLLRHFLKDPNHTFVGMWNQSDAKKLLFSSEHELEMARKPVNLSRHAVSRHDGRRLDARASRETIVRECLGFDVDFNTRIGRSDWEKYELDDEQILYAAVDAYCSFLIGKDLRAWEFANICSAIWTQEEEEEEEDEEDLLNGEEQLWNLWFQEYLWTYQEEDL
ncbi:hypothetical protein RHMOL_Rhmol04G0375300 [Rhododendron molle]|uniref:Uncharacterized protein n=1 Tax=Rhododendron molle TaxID=49168 RepID=A0ACC0PAS5_RHOML|nr:hypothetical protein RHMOL_Rhmol04G0375300 [Rhododendron molle]